jgi:hypothetical protein
MGLRRGTPPPEYTCKTCGGEGFVKGKWWQIFWVRCLTCGGNGLSPLGASRQEFRERQTSPPPPPPTKDENDQGEGNPQNG